MLVLSIHVQLVVQPGDYFDFEGSVTGMQSPGIGRQRVGDDISIPNAT